MATLMTSVGVPFINAGDERGRTQQGNNNAYCQDSEISWVDWSACDEQMLDFTRRVIALRRSTPELRRTQFFDGAYNPVTGLPDVVWLEGQGSLLCHDEWHDSSRTVFGAIISADPPLVFLFNRGETPQVFMLPGDAQCRWETVYDTARNPSFPIGDELPLQGGRNHALKAHSLVCLRLAAGRLELPVAY
jgi:glycogen operon protein